MKRGVLPAKKLSSALIRPTTAGLAPSGKSPAERKVDAIEAEARATIAAKEKLEEEKQKGLAGWTGAQVVSRILETDLDHVSSVEDMEKAIYAYLAQTNLALKAFDAKMTVEQLIAAKEAEAKADAAASEIAKAGAGEVAAPSAPMQPAGAPVAPTKASETPDRKSVV